MKNKLKLTVLLLSVVWVSNNLSAQNQLFEKAGSIKIKDSKAIMAGTKGHEDGIFEITLNDIDLYTGHTCGCDAAGFLITKNALEKLFPNEIYSRRSVNISISEYNMDLIDAISYITGTRLNRGEFTNAKSDFVVDKSLATDMFSTTIVFERKDNGNKVKATINKKSLLSADEMRVVTVIKDKIIKGEATKEEKELFAKTTNDIIEKEITNLPPDAFSYELLINTSQNKSKKVTFYELGSVRCIPCRQMQPIIKSIEEKYKDNIQVIFYDVWTAAGKEAAKNFTFDAIPTQIFVDENGKEFFRHVGYFPEEEIEAVLAKKGIIN